MTPLQRYASTCLAVIAVVSLALWPVLDPAARRGVLTAGSIAFPIQVAAFALLLRFRGRLDGFLAVWAGGTLFRMGVVGLVAFLAIRTDAPGSVAMLLALAGFFFGLLLLEPVYFRPEPRETN